MLILFFHGSSGISKLTTQYMKYLSNFGIVLCEKSKPIVKYKTNSKNYLKNPLQYKDIYKKVSKYREKQVTELTNLLKIPCIAVGISEGGIGVCLSKSKYIKKKIIIGYSGECNYFTNKQRPIKTPNIPHLFLIGSKDPFFSNQYTSMSSIVSRSNHSCKGDIKGRPYPYKNVKSFIILNKKHNVYSKSVKNLIKKFLS